MGCDLDKFTSYAVGQIVRDKAEHRITVQLAAPPAKCPDGSFTMKTGEIIIQDGVSPILTYSNTKKRPIILVPRKEMIQEVESGPSFFAVLFYAILLAAAIYCIYKLVMYFLNEPEEDGDDGGGSGKQKPSPGFDKAYQDYGVAHGHPQPKASFAADPAPRQTAPPPTQQQSAGTTVINNTSGGGNGNGLVTGIILGEMMAGNNHSTHTVEREIIHERDVPTYREPETSTFSSDSDQSTVSSDTSESSSFSSDSSDNSYSSDSGSSYSSDDSSSSSFSSDSGSDFSSSGSDSFSSDN